MSNSDDFLKALLTALTGKDPRVVTDDADRAECLLNIEKDVDLALVNALSDWFNSQSQTEPLKLGKVISSVCYWLALDIAKESASEEQACILTQTYCDYIHQAMHAIYRGEQRAASKKKSLTSIYFT